VISEINAHLVALALKLTLPIKIHLIIRTLQRHLIAPCLTSKCHQIGNDTLPKSQAPSTLVHDNILDVAGVAAGVDEFGFY